MSRRPSERLVVAMLGTALFATGCVHQSRPGVTLRKIDARLVFGVKLPTGAAPSPGETAAAPLFALPDVPSFAGIDIPTFLDDSRKKKVGCPAMPPGAAPERVAEAAISALPDPGIYTFKTVVTHKDGKAGTPVFTRRILKGFKRVEDATTSPPSATAVAVPPKFKYQFEMVQSIGASKFVQTTYLVNLNPTSAGAPSNAVYVPPRQGEPERGIVIKRIDVVDPLGNPVPGTTPFAPQFGLTILPLPINATEEFQSSSTDPVSGQTIVHTGAIGGQKLVIDACGDALDSWPINATQITAATAGGPSESSVTYDYAIAPQYGGIIVFERTTNATTGDVTVTSLADLFFDPLPPGVK